MRFSFRILDFPILESRLQGSRAWRCLSVFHSVGTTILLCFAVFISASQDSHGLPTAVHSSLGLSAFLNTDATPTTVIDFLNLNQNGTYFPNPQTITVVADGLSSTGGHSHADAFGDAQWIDSSQGSVRLDVAAWQNASNGFVGSGGPAASPGWQYTFVADQTGTFRLDYDIQGSGFGDFGALGIQQVGIYVFDWMDGDGNDLGGTVWPIPNMPAPLLPAFNFSFIGQETRQVVAGNAYTIRLDPHALFQHPSASASGDIHVVGMFDWSVDTASLVPPARTVFLDFGNGSWQPGSGTTPGWGSVMTKLANDVQFPTFTGAEFLAIERGIVAELVNVYRGFDIGFVSIQPTSGTYDSIDFKQDHASSNLGAPPNFFGWAPYDWLNANGSETGEVFPDQFDSILDEYSGGAAYNTPERDAAIREITLALASVAAHELGHTYGLDHLSAYGNPAIDPAATNGKQNLHVMGTGGAAGTGMNETEHELRRSLSRYSVAKFEATSSVSPEPLSSTSFASTTETIFQHADRNSAQNIDAQFQSLPISSVQAVNLREAAITSTDGLNAGGNLADWYEIILSKSAILTAEVFSQEGPYTSNGVSVNLNLHDGSALLEETHEVHHERDSMHFYPSQAGLTSQWEDSLLMNVSLGAGTYYLEVESFLGSTGDYDLFVNLIYPGDTDGDGDIDGDDLGAWEDSYGKNSLATASDGDMDSDGDVDGKDFLIWQLQFEPEIVIGDVQAIPEPCGLLLMLFGLSGMIIRYRG